MRVSRAGASARPCRWGRLRFRSRDNVNKHVDGGQTFVARGSPHPNTNNATWLHNVAVELHNDVGGFLGGVGVARRVPRDCCARGAGKSRKLAWVRTPPEDHSAQRQTLPQDRFKKASSVSSGSDKGLGEPYLLPSVEQALLLRGDIEDVLYFKP